MCEETMVRRRDCCVDRFVGAVVAATVATTVALVV